MNDFFTEFLLDVRSELCRNTYCETCVLASVFLDCVDGCKDEPARSFELMRDQLMEKGKWPMRRSYAKLYLDTNPDKKAITECVCDHFHAAIRFCELGNEASCEACWNQKVRITSTPINF